MIWTFPRYEVKSELLQNTEKIKLLYISKRLLDLFLLSGLA